MIKKLDEFVNHKLEHKNDIKKNMYIDLDREHRINFLLKNYDKVKKTMGVYTDSKTLYIYALLYTFRGICINNNMKNPKESLSEIIYIYEQMNEHNCEDIQILIANKIFEHKKCSDIIKVTEKVKNIYENIKNKDLFIDSLDDYVFIYLIGLNSQSIDKDLKSVEKIYKNLSEYGFNKNNTLKSLSYVLSFSKDEKALNKFIELKEAIEKNGIDIIDEALPMLGGFVLIDIYDISKVINEINIFSDKLKKYDSYDEIYLNEKYRIMIAIGLVLSKYHCDMEIEYAFMKKSIEKINQGIDTAIISSAVSSVLLASKGI